MSKCYFVTGTNTEVGKLSPAVRFYKPQRQQATGRQVINRYLWRRKDPKGLRNSDALALQRNSSLQLDYATVNLYTFAEPTSPHIVSAKRAGR